MWRADECPKKGCIMNLRNRTLLILAIIFFSLFILIAAVSFTVTLSGLDRIEYADMRKATGQVAASLNGESGILLSTVQDWAWWNETADFVTNNNSEYISSNLNPDSLSTIRVQLFLILDREGNPVYSLLLPPDLQSAGNAPDAVLDTIRNITPRVSHTGDDPGNTAQVCH